MPAEAQSPEIALDAADELVGPRSDPLLGLLLFQLIAEAAGQVRRLGTGQRSRFPVLRPVEPPEERAAVANCEERDHARKLQERRLLCFLELIHEGCLVCRIHCRSGRYSSDEHVPWFGRCA